MLIARRTDRSMLRPTPAPGSRDPLGCFRPSRSEPLHQRRGDSHAVIAGCVLPSCAGGMRTSHARAVLPRAWPGHVHAREGHRLCRGRRARRSLHLRAADSRGVRAAHRRRLRRALSDLRASQMAGLPRDAAPSGRPPTHFNLFLRFFDDGMINMTLIGRGWCSSSGWPQWRRPSPGKARHHRASPVRALLPGSDWSLSRPIGRTVVHHARPFPTS